MDVVNEIGILSKANLYDAYCTVEEILCERNKLWFLKGLHFLRCKTMLSQ